MLFVNLFAYKPGLSRQQIDDAAQRRARWKYPPNLRLLGEYWVQGSPSVISIIEADSLAPIVQANYPWGDVYDIQTHPALTVADALRVLQQAGVVRRRGRRPKSLRV